MDSNHLLSNLKLNLPSSIGSSLQYSSRFNENVEMRQYYYGERIPTEEATKRRKLYRPKSGSEMEIHVKCNACPKVFRKNSEIIPHVFEHIEADDSGTLVVRERCQPLRHSNLRCHICMKKTTMDSISIHVKNSHEMKNHPNTCRICELYYDSKKELVSHMHHTHPCLDMPYSCDICGYQASFRTSVFRHFEENHQKNFVMCNFCMVVLPVVTSADMKYLEGHLVQHVRQTKIKCPHCTLRFIGQEDLQAHLNQKHRRHADETKIEELKLYKLCKGEEPILMWIPLNKNPRQANVDYRPNVIPRKKLQHSNANADSDDDISIVFERVSASSLNGSHNSEESSKRIFKRQNDCNEDDQNVITKPTRRVSASETQFVPAELLKALGLQVSDKRLKN